MASVTATVEPTQTFQQTVDELRAKAEAKATSEAPTIVATSEVCAVKFSPDRKWLAVGTIAFTNPLSGSVAVRDCASNRVVKTWKVKGGAKYLAFSPDGKSIAVTGPANKLWVWKWKSGQLLFSTVVNKTDSSTGQMPVAYSPDGRTIAVGADGLQFFNTATWKKRQLSSEQSQYLTSAICYSPDGRLLLTCDGFESYDGYTIYPQPKGKMRQAPHYYTSGAVFSRDGKLFAGSGEYNKNGVYDHPVEGTFVFQTRTLKVKHVVATRFFTPLDFSPDGRFLVGIQVNWNIEIWNIASGKRARKLDDLAKAIVWLDAKTLLTGDENGVKKVRVTLN